MDIDGLAKQPTRRLPAASTTRLVAMVALIGMVGVALSIYWSLRAGGAARSIPVLSAQSLSRKVFVGCSVSTETVYFSEFGAHRAPYKTADEASGTDSQRARPSVGRPLFADALTSDLKQSLPKSQLSLAADIRTAEERGRDALWESHEALGIHPSASQKSASESLGLHIAPGRAIDGWLMRVHWSILRDRGGSSKYDYTAVPPIYELTFCFPDKLAGYEVWLWGHNYDFRSRGFTCLNRKFEAIKEGDWVKVFGVVRPGSRMEWEGTKSDDFLSLGEVTISDIERVEEVRE